MTTRRQVIAGIASLAVVGTATTACASSSRPATPNGPNTQRPDKVDLTVAVWGGTERADLYQKVLDSFVAKQQGVSATMQFADLGPYFERLTTSAASKHLPDLFWLTDTQFGRYAESGALLDLGPYLGNAIDVDGLGKQWLAYGQTKGATYGIPSHFNGQAILIDKSVFDQKAITYSAKSWDDLAALGAQLTRPGDGYWGITDPTIGQTQRGLEAWVRQSGQELYDKDGKVGFTRETLISWWKFWAKLRADRVIPPPDVQLESESQGVTNDLLTKRKAAIRLSSATHLSAIGNLRGGGLSLQTYPETPGGAKDWRFYTPLLLSSAANTPAPSVVAELLNVLVNDPAAAAITKISMGTPTPTKVAQSIEPKLSASDQAVVAYLTDQLTQPTRPTPLLPKASQQFIAEIARFAQEVAYGRMTPDAGADGLISSAARILK